MNLKLSARDKLIAIGLAVIVLFALSIVFLFRPQFTRISSIQAEQKVEAGKLEEAKLKLERLDAIRQEAAQIEAQRIALSRRMPPDAEIPSLIIDLQKTANAADLDLISISIDEASEQSGFEEIGLSLSGTGSFYTIVDFLYRLEEMTREVVLDDFQLSLNEYPQLTIDMTARTFKLTPGAAVVPDLSGQPASGEAAAEAGQ